MTIEELQAENAELKRQIAEDREKGQDLTVKTIFKLSDEIKALKAEIEEYEKKVKDGRLVELPHKMGDEVTFIDGFCPNYGLYERAIKTGIIVEIGFTITKEGRVTWQYVIECYDRVFKENDIKSRYYCSQENLFISKEEAEKKLRTDDYKWHTINGYTVFLTRAEAEKKLTGLKKEKARKELKENIKRLEEELKGEEQGQERLRNDNSAER